MVETTPSSPQTADNTPAVGSPSTAPESNATEATVSAPAPKKPKRATTQTGKKVSAEVLERRRAGRLKAAETMARKIKSSGIERRDNPLKYSVFETLTLINQKNYFTDYLKKDDQVFILRERRQLRLSKLKANQKTESTPQIEDDDAEEEDDEEEEEGEADEEEGANEGGVEKKIKKRAGSDIVVIHPGSKNLRIGLASDIYPKTVPFVIATPGQLKAEFSKSTMGSEEQVKKYEREREALQRDFKERMKYYKRRVLPNSNEVASNFNKKVQPENISEINDMHRPEYIRTNSQDHKKAYFGEEALRLDTNDYKLRWPLITNGIFNNDEYDSPEELAGEIQQMILYALESQYGIKSCKGFHTVLVIPDLHDKIYVETFIRLLLQLEFAGVGVIQESLAATYGAGVTQACVIDIGAQTTKVACIDDGMIVPNSRVVLNYGGDDITRLFYQLLKENSFPIDFDESNGGEWQQMEQLKEKFITFQDANITIQLYNFIKRYRDRLSEKYEFKVFDEVMLSPMALFFPGVFSKPADFLETSFTEKESTDIFTGEPNDPLSVTQKNAREGKLFSDKDDFKTLTDLLSNEFFDSGASTAKPALAELDKVIIQSITNGSRADFTKMKVFYENLLIVGGSSKIEALDLMLTDRINIWRSKILSYAQFPEFFKTCEGIVANFEKKHELSKLPTDDSNLPRLKEELDALLSAEMETFLESANNTLLNVEVLPAPREIDPSILTWKGGAVFARLKIMEELWISENDWDLLGSRTLQHKLLFNY